MAELLKELREKVEDAEKKKIDDALADVMEDIADASTTITRDRSPPRRKSSEPDDERGEANVSAEVGSNHDMAMMDEELLHDPEARATGFIGKSSEIQWMRRLHHDAGRSVDSLEGPYGTKTPIREKEEKGLSKYLGSYVEMPLLCCFHVALLALRRILVPMNFMQDTSSWYSYANRTLPHRPLRRQCRGGGSSRACYEEPQG